MNLLAIMCFFALGCFCTITGMMFTFKIVKQTINELTDNEE